MHAPWHRPYLLCCATSTFFLWPKIHRLSTRVLFLPPASEGWGKVLFSVCLSTSGGGVPHPRSGRGGYPIPGLGGGGVLHPRSGQGTPPDLGWGTPPGPGMRTRDGVPPRPGMGYPPGPGMGYPPRPGMGYLPGPGMGTPPDLGHSEHLLFGGRYASCVHAGGLSCF